MDAEAAPLCKCSICLDLKTGSLSLYNLVHGRHLPSVIEGISGIQVSPDTFPDAVICSDCALALIQAESIIEKCRSSLTHLLQNVKEELSEECITLEVNDYKESAEALRETLIEIKAKAESSTTSLSSPIDLDDCQSRHVDRKTHIIDIPGCKRKYTRRKEGKRVLKTNRKADWHFTCELCPYESDFAAYYRNHLVEIHRIEKPKIFKCKQCVESYQLHSSLRHHIAVVHEKQKRPPRARNILCSECGKKFPCRNTLSIHMHVHTGEPLPCRCIEDECNKSFASMAALQYHRTSAHSQEKKFACEICGNSFALIFNLRTHMSKCHLGNELKDCPNCGRSYRSLKKYEAHVLGEKCKNAIHPCKFPNCHKRFSRPRKMRLHMLNVHKTRPPQLD